MRQRLGLRNIGHLATGELPAHRVAERIDNRANLACPPATRTACRLLPFSLAAGSVLVCSHRRTVGHQHFQIAVATDNFDDSQPYTGLTPGSLGLPGNNGDDFSHRSSRSSFLILVLPVSHFSHHVVDAS